MERIENERDHTCNSTITKASKNTEKTIATPEAVSVDGVIQGIAHFLETRTKKMLTNDGRGHKRTALKEPNRWCSRARI